MAAELRCPMCSKLNPPGAEECGFCGARLRPLVVGGEPEGSRISADGTDDGAEASDWLDRMRAGSGADEFEENAPEDEADSAGSPDWLGRLREVGPSEEGPPPGEVPDWLGTPKETTAEAPGEETGGAELAEVPDWLSRVRDRQAQEAEPAWGAEPEDGGAEGQEDWLARIRDGGIPANAGPALPPLTPDSAVEAPTPGGRPSPDWIERGERLGAGDSIEPVEDSGLAWDIQSGTDLGWLEEVAPAEGSDLAQAGPAAPPREGWLAELETPSDELPEGTGEEAKGVEPAASWLGNAEIAVERPFTGEDEEIIRPETGEADWLKELEVGADEPSSWEDRGQRKIWETAGEGGLGWLAEYDASVGKKPDEAGEPTPEGEQLEPGWLSEIRAPDQVLPSEPEAVVPAKWEEAAQPERTPAGELPHVAALVFGAQEPGGGAQTPDIDLSSLEVELPDWLGEHKAAPAGGEPAGPGGVDLAPATLPARLEAMRPIATFRSVVEVAEEEEQALESAGPLAGLRGVLMAEPVVAMPRAPTIGAAKLEVTERQYAQAELLHKMVEEEERELPSADRRRLRLPLVRWAVSAVLLMAVILPITLGIPSFPLPSQVSRDLKPLMALVNGLPVDRPSLVVFDYDPGYSGEMNAVAGAFIDQLMGRGVPVVSLSTRPYGPALAAGLLDRIASGRGVPAGTGYLHLGYLSGGPTAVQIFAAAPQDAVRQGFDLPADAEGQAVCGGWDCPILSNVHRLSDFSMVAVLSSGTENARTWAEQAHPYLGQVPLVMVLSAGAEPLIRPYYEALEPQVNGILSGLPAAVAYEQANQLPGEAHARWNPFGAALMAIEFMLAAGVVYALARRLLRSGRAQRG